MLAFAESFIIDNQNTASENTTEYDNASTPTTMIINKDTSNIDQMNVPQKEMKPVQEKVPATSSKGTIRGLFNLGGFPNKEIKAQKQKKRDLNKENRENIKYNQKIKRVTYYEDTK